MIHAVVKEGNPAIPIWIDVVDPTPEELFGLAENYQLHPNLVRDCLEPDHLPKHEKHDDTTFLIVRHYDENADPTKNTVQAITRKLALFIGDRFLISIHRKEQPFISKMRDLYSKTEKPVFLQVILFQLLTNAVETFHAPLIAMETQIQDFEFSLLKNKKSLSNWNNVFRTKCRLTIIKRLLWHTLDTLQKFTPYTASNLPLRQEVIERIQSVQFLGDSLLDDLNGLLNIQLSLATHQATEASNRMNQVMKVLTIFSAFFLPLNFIVGIYGMNFEHMPELKLRFGYLGVWIALITTAVLIYTWFVKKGWIRLGHFS